MVSEPVTNVDLAPTFLHLAGDACDATTGRCTGSAAHPGPNSTAPLDGRSLLPLLLGGGHSRAAAAAGWRGALFLEYYFNDRNTKCVANCSAESRSYPQADASCASLGSTPNGVCWGGVDACTGGCYPTEDESNNFIGLRRVVDGAAADGTWLPGGTLYAEYQEGRFAGVDFSAPTFYELFDAQSDPWHMHNLHATAGAHLKAALHAELHAWYGCMGETCP